MVPVPKKDRKVRMSIDFKDLNKANPKDDFPLPHIDILVNNIVGHALLSFMNGFARYNLIKMALEDMEKPPSLLHGGHIATRSYHKRVKMIG